MLPSPNDPIFLLIVSAVTQRPHLLLLLLLFCFCFCFFVVVVVVMWALRSLSSKDPLFLHSAATGSYFLFQFHRQIDHFCHFRRFFSSNSCFKSAHWKIKRNILTQCPLILNQNLASHPMTPHFLKFCSHRMPQPLDVWALHPYLFDIGVPPPPYKQREFSRLCWSHNYLP